MFLCYLARAWRCPKKKVHSLKETKSLERCWHCIKNKVRFRGTQSLGSAQEVAEQGLGGPVSKNRQLFCSKRQWSQTKSMLRKEVKAKLHLATSLSRLGKAGLPWPCRTLRSHLWGLSSWDSKFSTSKRNLLLSP